MEDSFGTKFGLNSEVCVYVCVCVCVCVYIYLLCVPGGQMVTHSSILAWRIPWTEAPGGLQPSPWGHKESDMTEHRAHPLCYISFIYYIYISLIYLLILSIYKTRI